MKKIEGDVLRGHLELLVLSVLHRGETHGYEILQRLERQAAGALRESGDAVPGAVSSGERGTYSARDGRQRSGTAKARDAAYTA